MPTRARDRGSATIYAALLASLLTALAGAVLAFGSAVLARHRAGTAADLAALSAAVHADTGAPCDWARRVAVAQRVRLVRCACDGPVCLVSAAAGTPWGAATVTSRAGPTDDPRGSDVVAAGVTVGAER
uniref:Rv3654c family TadE-like protein n=1 Tax=Catenulispora pinisilvae TaxID=2705253 RepID=UPI0018919759